MAAAVMMRACGTIMYKIAVVGAPRGTVHVPRLATLARYSPSSAHAGRPMSAEEVAFDIAFTLLDRDGDGRISQAEAYRLLAYVSATRASLGAAAAAAQASGRAWPHASAGALSAAAEADALLPPLPPPHAVAAKLAESSAAAAAAASTAAGSTPQAAGLRLSDYLCAAVGAGTAAVALAHASAGASPGVGPLLLAAFGAAALPLFAGGAHSAAAAATGLQGLQRAWPLLAGALAAGAAAAASVALFGAGTAAARAAAAAAAMAMMMRLRCVSGVGGVLVLMLADGRAATGAAVASHLAQAIGIALGVAAPLIAATSALKRAAGVAAGAHPGKRGGSGGATGAPRRPLATSAVMLDSRHGLRGPPPPAAAAANPDAWRAALLEPPGSAVGARKWRVPRL